MGTVFAKPQQPNNYQQLLRQATRRSQVFQQQLGQLRNTVLRLSQALAEAQQRARRQKDPRLYRQLKEEALNIFYEKLETFQFTSTIPKREGQNHHMLIGNISAGKTSLINYFCHLNLKVGIGETTTSAQITCSNKDNTIHIWDSPGSNEEFTFSDIKTLRLFWQMDKIFIVYCDSLRSCPDLVKTMHKIKPNSTFLVRSMCDRGESNQSKTIEEELQTDRRIINGWGINMPILATSAKRDKRYLNNQAFCDLLIGQA